MNFIDIERMTSMTFHQNCNNYKRGEDVQRKLLTEFPMNLIDIERMTVKNVITIAIMVTEKKFKENVD